MHRRSLHVSRIIASTGWSIGWISCPKQRMRSICLKEYSICLSDILHSDACFFWHICTRALEKIQFSLLFEALGSYESSQMIAGISCAPMKPGTKGRWMKPISLLLHMHVSPRTPSKPQRPAAFFAIAFVVHQCLEFSESRLCLRDARSPLLSY